MEECVRMMQQNLRSAPTIKQRAKSVKMQRNLGTIKDRKREKRKETESSNGEIIMRILRMRYAFPLFIFVYYYIADELVLPLIQPRLPVVALMLPGTDRGLRNSFSSRW